VTIGSLDNPVKAALLDLKTKNPDADNVTVENSKSGGLVLPRVQLESKTTLEPFIPKDSEEWKRKQDETKRLHVGMMVYNLKSGGVFSPGIYVWNGSEWVKDEINASNGLTKTGDNIQLGGTLTQKTIIDQDINFLTFTGNSSKIYLENVKNNIPTNTEKIATMGIHSENGELFIMKANDKETTTTKAISYVVYKLTGKGAKVRNFETQIKVKDYTLMVVGSRFATQATYGGLLPDGLRTGGTPISSVYADKYVQTDTGQTSTDGWVIHANYEDAKPSDGKDGTWTVYCLVFNNSIINVHKDNAMEFGNGSKTIDAGNPPAGLK
jgi:hypothetical protein